MRRYLVIVRAGDASLHPSWLRPERSWDLIVNYFGDDPDKYFSSEVRRIDSKGPKWPALYALMESLIKELDTYDYIWFPDDDLACEPIAIDHFFALCHEHKLDLAQPALTHNSHIGVGITVANRSFLLRYTNFVEIMAPCFSRSFLNRCWPSFNTSLSGWGLDFLWPSWVSDPCKVAIIDAVKIIHTRPHGGPNYHLLKERGIDPEQELQDLLAKEGLKLEHVIRGGMTREGKVLSLWRGDHNELFHQIMIGYLPEFTNFPEILFSIVVPILESLSQGPGLDHG